MSQTPLQCLIVDDEPLAHNVIKEYASHLPQLEIVAQAYHPLKAIEILRTKNIDLMFLDIQMPKLNGLEMLRLSNNVPQVIITSAYEEYALESYELNVCDYLLKPFRLERFIQAVDRAMGNQKMNLGNDLGQKDYLLLKTDKRYVQIEKDEISFIESYGNYVKVWRTDDFILVKRTLTSLEDELKEHLFYKVHKSFIVNKSKIKFIEGNSVTLKNGKFVPISKSNKPGFMEFMN